MFLLALVFSNITPPLSPLQYSYYTVHERQLIQRTQNAPRPSAQSALTTPVCSMGSYLIPMFKHLNMKSRMLLE